MIAINTTTTTTTGVVNTITAATNLEDHFSLASTIPNLNITAATRVIHAYYDHDYSDHRHCIGVRRLPAPFL